MTLLLLFSIVLIFFSAVSLIIYPKLFAPPVILGAVFVVSYTLIEVAYGSLENQYCFYGCYVIAAALFAIGFYSQLQRVPLRNKKLTMEIEFSKQIYPVLLGAAYLIIVLQLIVLMPIILQSSGNIWHNVRRNYEGNMLFNFFNLFVVILFFISFFIWNISPSTINKKRLFMVAPTIFPYVVSMHRGVWFMILITMLFIWLFVKCPNSISTLRIGSVALVVIGGLICVSSLWKFGDYFTSTKELASTIARTYFSSQFVAFREKMQSSPQLLYGQNTFRFFIAVAHSLGNKLEPIDIVQPFTYVYGYATNVFTGLSYYASDFGMWWAYCIELLLGVVYGQLYKRAFSPKKINSFAIIFLAMLMYPLINQFFDDKYFSVFSEWLKECIFLWLLTRPQILVIKPKKIEVGEKNIIDEN